MDETKLFTYGVVVTVGLTAAGVGHDQPGTIDPHLYRLAAIQSNHPDDDHPESPNRNAPLVGAPYVTSTSTASAQFPEFWFLDDEVEDDTPYLAG